MDVVFEAAFYTYLVVNTYFFLHGVYVIWYFRKSLLNYSTTKTDRRLVNLKGTFKNAIHLTFIRLGFIFLGCHHFIELMVWYYYGSTNAMMMIHHTLTVLLMVWILENKFYNAYSILPLTLHYLTAINYFHYLSNVRMEAYQWPYGLYVFSYVMSITYSLIYRKKLPKNKITWFLRAFILLHTLNLAGYGFGEDMSMFWFNTTPGEVQGLMGVCYGFIYFSVKYSTRLWLW